VSAPTATPTVGRQVTISVPGIEELPAKVTGKGEDYVTLQLLARPTAPLGREQIFLEFVTDDGMWRTLGTVVVQAAEHGESLRFEPQGRIQLLQRRAHVRTDCIAAVIFTPDGAAPRRCLTLNLSGGGLLARGLTGVEVGEEAAFDLRLDLLPARIQGRCRIVRYTPEGFAGVQFTEIDEGERDRLVRFAYQREKAAREARFGY
jgi:c-di-GMP-binding flagellar brake protein YcgR